MNKLRESVARAIEDAQIGYNISLTRLVDGVSTYECRVDGVEGVIKFDGYSDALEFVTERKRRVQADAAILAMFNHLAANVSEGMSQAGFDNNTYRWADEAFRAMIEQARKEYEETAP